MKRRRVCFLNGSRRRLSLWPAELPEGGWPGGRGGSARLGKALVIRTPGLFWEEAAAIGVCCPAEVSLSLLAFFFFFFLSIIFNFTDVESIYNVVLISPAAK